MTINYQFWKMCFVDGDESGQGDDVLVMNDDNLDSCFKALVERQRDVVVICRPGWLRRLIDYVREHYIYVKAAGGLVVNADGKLLLMERNGRADLPKGKVEEGETLAQAALRETQEETGLSHIRLGKLRLKTYHIYDLYGGWHFKQTSWFDMLQLDDQPFVPQVEEGITGGEWLPAGEWASRLSESYATMRIIASQIFEK